MAIVKFTELVPAGSIVSSDIFAISQVTGTPISLSVTAQNIFDYVATGLNLSGGNGIDYDSNTGVIAADINTTNLQFTTGQINTIQDIATTSSPVFGGMTVNLGTATPFAINSTTAGFLAPQMTSAQIDNILSPDNGLLAWATDLDRFKVNVGTTGSPNYQEIAYLSDINSITSDGALGQTYFSNNSAPTLISGIGVPVNIAGVFQSANLVNMSASPSGSLTNTSADTLNFTFVATMTVTLNFSTADVKGYMYKNGTTVVSVSEPVISVDGTTPSYKTLTMSGHVSLAPNDSLIPKIANQTNTDEIIVNSINFKANTIGGGGGGSGTTTLEQAYTAGDGTMIMTAGKPLEFQSNDLAVVPEFNLRLTQIPSANDVVGTSSYLSKNSSGDDIPYFNFTTAVADPTQNNEATAFAMFARKNDLVTETGMYPVLTYSGIRDLTNFPRRASVGPSGRGIASTLFTISSPTENYPTTQYTNIAQTIRGQNIILPNSFDVGDVIEIDCYGALEIVVSDVAVGDPSTFRISFGNILTVTSNNVSATTLPQDYSGWFHFKFKIIRSDLNAGSRLNVSGSGLYLPPEGLKTISWPNTVFTTQYVPGQSYPLSIEFQRGVTGFSQPGDRYDFVAWGCNVQQYSAGDNQPPF